MDIATIVGHLSISSREKMCVQWLHITNTEYCAMPL